MKKRWSEVFTLTVAVAGLGYFVDLFDIALFGVVRVGSLRSLGITDPKAVLDAGVFLYNLQMVGMMIGGVFWGVLADKKGRLSVMFGSILLYSLGNIANAFAGSLETYAACRLLSGIGLAGELGAAITIVAETLPKEVRGLGTTIVATLGLAGSITAAFVGQRMDWRAAYFAGGVMGLLLLCARLRLRESFLFLEAAKDGPPRGSLAMLFTRERLGKYLSCVAVGAPIYLITGVLFTFSPELTRGLGVRGEVTAGNALLYGSIGLTLGDLGSGLLSQLLRSRKRAVSACLAGAALCVAVYLLRTGSTAREIYVLCFLLGACAGYWAVLVTMAAEQFGTNLRGTVATTVPNFVRGSATLATLAFSSLKDRMPVGRAALLLAVVWFALAFLGLRRLRETFTTDLDFVES